MEESLGVGIGRGPSTTTEFSEATFSLVVGRTDSSGVVEMESVVFVVELVVVEVLAEPVVLLAEFAAVDFSVKFASVDFSLPLLGLPAIRDSAIGFVVDSAPSSPPRLSSPGPVSGSRRLFSVAPLSKGLLEEDIALGKYGNVLFHIYPSRRYY